LFGTPLEFTRGDSAKAITIYVTPLSLTVLLLLINLKPFAVKSIIPEVVSSALLKFGNNL
jgi:hypothetical protein